MRTAKEPDGEGVRSSVVLRSTSEAEAGFTLLELIFVMLIVGTLATVGLSAYGSYKDRTWKMEANAGWHELSMAVNIYRIDYGDWPAPYTGAEELEKNGKSLFAAKLLGPLKHNLAPNGGPTEEQPTGHMILADGAVCVWVGGIAAEWNDPACP